MRRHWHIGTPSAIIHHVICSVLIALHPQTSVFIVDGRPRIRGRGLHSVVQTTDSNLRLMPASSVTKDFDRS